ncbi:MAG: YceI-like family protein [Bryobacterales bacterium]|nr:YceI-like family protein [Bryobacterales bacterium]
MRFFVFSLLVANTVFAQAPVAPAVQAPAAPNSWRIDPLHSQANFTVKHMMISTVRGTFGGVRGTIIYDPKNPAASSVEATIDCSTLNTGEPKRDSDLRGEEFFDVKKYPVMKFKSKSVRVVAPGEMKVTGDLTINATTKQVVLDLEGPTEPVKDTQGRTKVGVSATTKISRKDYGILYNPVMETGGVVVSDQVSITLDIELIKN